MKFVLSYLIALVLFSIPASFSYASTCTEIIFGRTQNAKRVERADVEKNIATLLERSGGRADREGFFGPSSMMWEINRVPFLMLFATTELYLQLAHPPSAQGVYDHSKRLKEQPIQRFQSTFFYIWGMVYGDVEQASKFALTLNQIHSRITGTLPVDAGPYKAGYEYSANDPFALLWIHATHWYAVMRTYEVFVRRLTLQERNSYINDTKKYAMLLGIPEEMIPANWQEFKEYFDTMIQSEELTYSRDAKLLEKHFQSLSRAHTKFNPSVWLARKYSNAITASTLPERFANEFGLNRSRVKQGAYYSAIKALKAAYTLMPKKIRDLPLYNMAKARSAGKNADYSDELMYQLFTNKITPAEFIRSIIKHKVP